MSGSSLDGLDIVYCILTEENGQWTFDIRHAECKTYSGEWTQRLKTARELDGRSLWKLHTDYGHLLSDMVNEFVSAHDLTGKVDIIASHGHTIFHFPAEKFTTQIGDGAALAVRTGIKVVSDLRSSDIALGGQGTPIVPIGDVLLFGKYPYLLNIGGIANLTAKTKNGIIAYDICTANQILNHYASLKGMEYDKDGALAATGKINEQLLVSLSRLEYYANPNPKSLDNGYGREVLIPLMEGFDISIADKLCTYCEHIAISVADAIRKVQQQEGSSNEESDRMLITGGGALHKHLAERISLHSPISIFIPDLETVLYKEALVMALIGALRLREEPTVLSAVTGASRDTIGGALYHP
jgi:anhydro-N-acetylmuramic acid kinase